MKWINALPLLTVTLVTACTGSELATLNPNPDSVTLLSSSADQCQVNRPQLSEAQQDEIQAIQDNKRTQIEAVLTPEQLAQLDQLKPAADFKGVRPNQLQLTEAQQEQIRLIRQETRQAMATFFEDNRIDPPDHTHRHLRRQLKRLDLTASQEEELQQIREASRVQFQATLTPEQMELVETARREDRVRDLRGQLNFTDAQQQQLCELKQSTHTQIEAMLTPDQLEQIQISPEF